MNGTHKGYKPVLLAAVFGVWQATCGRAETNSEESFAFPVAPQDWETFTTLDGLPHNSIRALCVHDDAVWVGTDAGLAVLEDQRWKSWARLDPDGMIPFPAVSAIDVDPRTADVWIGTWGEGIIRQTAGRFDRFDQFNSGLAGNLVFDLVFVSGRVWAATNGGISSFDPVTGVWGLYLQRRAAPLETAAVSLRREPSERYLYIGTWCDGVRRIELGNGAIQDVIRPPANSGPVPNQPCRKAQGLSALAVGPAGDTLWRAAQSALFRRVGGEIWEARSFPRRGSHNEWIHCIALRSDTQAWLGTDQGLLILADWGSDTWITFSRCETGAQTLIAVHRDGRIVDTRLLDSILPDNRVRCVAFQGDDVWIGTANGLIHGIVREDRAASYAIADNRAERALSTSASCPGAQAATNSLLRSARPNTLRTVAIGILSPVNKTAFLPGQESHASGGLRQLDPAAVQLAMAEANACGGYRGSASFAAVLPEYGYARYGWTLPEDGLITLARREDVRGIVAHLSPSLCFTAAAVCRSEVPVVSSAPRPDSVGQGPIPWVFHCADDGRQRQEKLLDYAFSQLGVTRPALLRLPGQAARSHLDHWARLAREAGHPPLVDFLYDPKSDDFGSVLEAIRRSRADVLLTWCDDDVASHILHRMRKAGMRQLFVGGPQIVTNRFLRSLEDTPDPVLAAWGCPRQADELARKRFALAYVTMFGRAPGPTAFQSHHAATHLLRAINLAGIAREDIRRTLEEMSSAYMARLENGQWKFGPSPER